MDYNQYQQNFNTPDNNVYGEPQSFGPPPKKQTDVMAIISLVCGILAIIMLCCCYYLSFPLGIAGVVLAIISRSKNEGKFSGLALAGLICGGVAFVGAIIWAFVAIFLGVSTSLMEM